MKIVSYNINGLKNKLLFQKFFEYIKSFDIFLLLETHIEEDKYLNYEKYFNGYHVFWKRAIRSSTYGRASGGCLYGVSKNLTKLGLSHTFKRENFVDTIELKIKDEVVSIIPLYINGTHWVDEFSLIKSYLTERDQVTPIIIGDLNARIGNLEQIVEDMYKSQCVLSDKRTSKDSIINSKGRKLMEFCNSNGLVVLNGMSRSDSDGSFTYISNSGDSVIDICAVSQECLYMVRDFMVENQIWADHMPIVLWLEIPQSENVIYKQNLLPKLIWDEKNTEQYRHYLDINLADLKNIKQELSVEDFIDTIRKSSKQPRFRPRNLVSKSKWFDNRCRQARSKSFHWLRKYKKSANPRHKIKYLAANKTFKVVCEQTKENYYKQLEQNISKVNDSKEFWKLVKEINNNQRSCELNITKNVFKQYFQELLNPQQFSKDVSYAPNFIEIHELDMPITVDEISAMLSKTKSNKAPGLDGIPYEFFKNSNRFFLEELAKVFTRIYDTGNLDNTFETSIILPIFKKGDKNNPENYRGISFNNCVTKILMGILNERLSKWVESNNILNEYQAGFRKKYSTSDNIYNLGSIIHIKLEEKKKVYAFFVDFKAAFDKVPRKLMIYKLFNMGISYKMVNFIASVYSNTKSVVWVDDDFSEEFSTYTGVKQGCLLSPLLFALYLNDLNDHLEGGLELDDLNIRLLLYADDIVILADNIDVLQNMINNLEVYCDTWNMEVNLRKSAIMVFRRGGKLASKEKWVFKGGEINIVSEYCYLGVILTPQFSFRKHVSNRNLSAQNSIMATWNSFYSKDNISLSVKWKLFLAVCRAVQSYAAQVWGYSLFEEVDKLQLFFIKRILKLPDNSPTYGIMLETGMENGHLYTLKLHIGYIMKTLFEYDSNRLPHKLSCKVLVKNVFWAKTLNELGNQYGISWNLANLNKETWNELFTRLVDHIKRSNQHKMWVRAVGSNTGRIYKWLDHNCGAKYFKEGFSRSKIMWIFKARCGLLYLNGSSFSNQRLCTICNLNEDENTQHFIGRCPIFASYRRRFFGKPSLNEEEIINVLNGINDENWDNLVNYIMGALTFRSLILNEYS